jgi:hypothetical protein
METSTQLNTQFAELSNVEFPALLGLFSSVYWGFKTNLDKLLNNTSSNFWVPKFRTCGTTTPFPRKSPGCDGRQHRNLFSIRTLAFVKHNKLAQKHTDVCHTCKSSGNTSNACYTYAGPSASCPYFSISKTHLLTGGGGCGGGGCIWGAGGAMKPGIGGAGAATGNGGRAGTECIYSEQ